MQLKQIPTDPQRARGCVPGRSSYALWLLCLAGAIHCLSADQTGLYVNPSDGSDDSQCGDEVSPCLSIKYVVENRLQSSYDKQINLKPGIYSVDGNCDLSIEDSFFAVKSTEGGVWIDCSSSQPFISAVGNSTKVSIEGVTITNTTSKANGGCIQASGIFSLELRNVAIRNSRSESAGGALSFTDIQDKVVLHDVSVHDSVASNEGGALACHSSTMEIQDVKLLRNSAGLSSGGMHLSSCHGVTVHSIDIKDNVSPKGAAIGCLDTSILIKSAELLNNTDSMGGGSEWYCLAAGCNILEGSANGISQALCNVQIPSLSVNTAEAQLLRPESSVLIDFHISETWLSARSTNISVARAVMTDEGDAHDTVTYEIKADSAGSHSGPSTVLHYQINGFTDISGQRIQDDSKTPPYFLDVGHASLSQQIADEGGGGFFFAVYDHWNFKPFGRIKRTASESVRFMNGQQGVVQCNVTCIILQTDTAGRFPEKEIFSQTICVADAPGLFHIGQKYAMLGPMHAWGTTTLGAINLAGGSSSLLTMNTTFATQHRLHVKNGNASAAGGQYHFDSSVSSVDSGKSVELRQSATQVLEVPSGGYSYVVEEGSYKDAFQVQVQDQGQQVLPVLMSWSLKYDIGGSGVPLGMTFLEIVLFATPRLFLIVTGGLRVHKILNKQKVVASVYPPSVKQKLMVNAALSLCPSVLWACHSAAGLRVSLSQELAWAFDTGSWLFSCGVLYLEHSRAMPQSWVPLRVWWILAFYSASLSLFQRLATSKDLDLLFFPYMAQYVLYLAAFLQGLLHKDSALEYEQIISGPDVERVTKGDKTAVFMSVVLAMFTGQLVYGLAVLVLPAYARQQGISQSALGLLVGCYALATLLSSPFFGVACEKYGRRNVLLGGLTGLALSTIVFALSGSIWTLALARIMQGISAAANSTSGQSVLADTFSQESLGAVLGTAAGWSGLGLLLGPPLGGFLFDMGGYQLPFLLGAGLAFVDVLVVALLLEDTPPSTVQHDSVPTSIIHSKIPIILGVIVLGGGSLTMMEPTLPLFVQKEFKATMTTIGLLFGCGVVAYGVMSPIAGHISDKFGRGRVMATGLVLLGISLPVLTLPTSLFGVGVALVFMGLSCATAVVGVLPELASEAMRLGTTSFEVVYAIFNTAYAFGNIVGPMVGLALVDAVGIHWTFLLFGILVASYSVPFYKSYISSPTVRNQDDSEGKSYVSAYIAQSDAEILEEEKQAFLLE